MDWGFVSPTIHALKSDPQCDRIWRGGLGVVIRSRRWRLHDGVSDVIKQDLRALPLSLLFTMWGYKAATCWPWGRSSPDTTSARTRVLDSPASTTVRNKCLLVQPPVYGIFVTAAWAKTAGFLIGSMCLPPANANFTWKHHLVVHQAIDPPPSLV